MVNVFQIAVNKRLTGTLFRKTKSRDDSGRDRASKRPGTRLEAVKQVACHAVAPSPRKGLILLLTQSNHLYPEVFPPRRARRTVL